MKSCIIKRYYQSTRNPKIEQTLYLKAFHGGEYIKGDWVEDKQDAYIFDRKSHAKSICKGMRIEGLSLIEK